MTDYIQCFLLSWYLFELLKGNAKSRNNGFISTYMRVNCFTYLWSFNLSFLFLCLGVKTEPFLDRAQDSLTNPKFVYTQLRKQERKTQP